MGKLPITAHMLNSKVYIRLPEATCLGSTAWAELAPGLRGEEGEHEVMWEEFARMACNMVPCHSHPHILRAYMEYLWNICGISMEYLWNMMVFNAHDSGSDEDWRYLP